MSGSEDSTGNEREERPDSGNVLKASITACEAQGRIANEEKLHEVTTVVLHLARETKASVHNILKNDHLVLPSALLRR